MNAVTVDVFDKAVRDFFAPIAEQCGLQIVRISDGLYEIPSSHCNMRIQLGIGHSKGLSVTLCPAQKCSENSNGWDTEIGLPVIAKYNGYEIQFEYVGTATEHRLQASNLSSLAKIYCVPYLLGNKSDLAEIQAFVEKAIEESGIQHKKWNFPKNVREEWPLPED